MKQPGIDRILVAKAASYTLAVLLLAALVAAIIHISPLGAFYGNKDLDFLKYFL